mgnify:CR=1 FL=1
MKKEIVKKENTPTTTEEVQMQPITSEPEPVVENNSTLMINEEVKETYEQLSSINLSTPVPLAEHQLAEVDITNVEDEKVIDYLKFLTFLSKEEIEELEEKNKTQPHLREAHKALAKEVAMSNIRVNAVAPGVINTEMISNLDEEVLIALKKEKISFQNIKAYATKYEDGSIVINKIEITGCKSPTSAEKALRDKGIDCELLVVE